MSDPGFFRFKLPRTSTQASTREMSVAALPIAATRDRSENWKQRSGREKSPPTSSYSQAAASTGSGTGQ